MTDNIVEHFRRFAAERRSMIGTDPNDLVALHAGHDEREIILTVSNLLDAAAAIEERDSRIAELEAENARLREESEWRPIETAPKYGTHILGFHPESAQAHGYMDAGLCVLRWVDADEDGEWEAEWQIQPFSEGLDCIISDAPPTMWRPLPTPPKGEDNG